LDPDLLEELQEGQEPLPKELFEGVEADEDLLVREILINGKGGVFYAEQAMDRYQNLSAPGMEGWKPLLTRQIASQGADSTLRSLSRASQEIGNEKEFPAKSSESFNRSLEKISGFLNGKRRYYARWVFPSVRERASFF